MTRWPGIGALLIPGVAAAAAGPACLAFATHPEGAPLARFDAARGEFAITYVHSVTRTPVEERYRVDGSTLVETEIRFRQHGPGLPTEADAGGEWHRDGDAYVVSMTRRFDGIAMRVHADQSWRLAIDGASTSAVNLTQWGDRAIALSAHSGACASGSAASAVR